MIKYPYSRIGFHLLDPHAFHDFRLNQVSGQTEVVVMETAKRETVISKLWFDAVLFKQTSQLRLL